MKPPHLKYSASSMSTKSVFDKEDNSDITPVTMKLESDELKSIYTTELNTLAEIFKRNGFELRIAGGAVR
jgi:hypothetical protein